ncbi:MAG TPA: isocitrate lyase/phosphoenolpyruvate mutase family protein [Pseudonocardiaceae bacterium]|nr:isocitrate lyase/phosphoenolpyruvate mutase family protein [Pseudonocardiaceae bacterium]
MLSQQDKAKAFHELHSGAVLVLPNAWDAASARLIEQAGAVAVATTSAGMSWSLGVPDGGHLGSADAVAAVARVTAAVSVPVTADIEGGYARDLDGLADVVRAVLAVGAVGINLEDSADGGLLSEAEHCARIGVVRRVASEVGVDLFVNVRTDVYLVGGDPDELLSAALRRAEAYLAVGADGIFVPGVVDEATIGALAGGISAPLNVMAGPGSPTVSRLADLGVARVSVGQAIAQAAYAVTRRAAVELLSAGSYQNIVDGVGYGELNTLLAQRSH